MMGPMGQQGPMMGPIGQQGPMMGQRRPIAPMMGPMGHQGPMMGPQGPMPQNGKSMIPLRNMQNVMELEAKLEALRRELVQGFYMDLMAYKQISTQFKKRMAQKLSMIRQIEAKLASPIRRALATGRMQLPLAPPQMPQSSTTITTYRRPTVTKPGDKTDKINDSDKFH